MLKSEIILCLGLANLKKDTYIKRFDECLKIEFYEKVKGELTKNHQNDNEDVSSAGIIPFHADQFGYNPGRLIEIYMSSLNERNENLFQRPLEASKKFDIHLASTNVWFANANIGKNKVSTILPSLCGILGIPSLTNHCIRATGIRALKRAQFEDRKVKTT